jgi:tRNA A-37 threonylcarbamoyl transferase component Bud32
LAAYCAGRLARPAAQQIERWLDTLSEAQQAEILEAHGADRAQQPLQGIAISSEDQCFRPDHPPGRIEPGTELGRGGMGIVTLAHDRFFDRTIALKTLKPRGAAEPLANFLLREVAFRREATITATLDHPAIIPIYEYGHVAGLPAFTMKRVVGQTLATLVAARATTSISLIDAIRHVSEAVGHAHQRGIVHRDLTPANIVIGDLGAVYVLDWGLAGICGSADNLTVGTPSWMAPEQQTGAVPDPRMDVFALGGLLLFVLTGRGPRRDDGTIDLNGADLRRLPRALSAVVRRCCALAPTERYPDGAAVASDLMRWQNDGLTQAQEASALEHLWQLVRRNQRARLLLGTGGGIVLTIGLLLLWQTQVDRREAVARATRLADLADSHDQTAVDQAASEARTLHRTFPGLPAVAMATARLDQAAALLQRMAAEQRVHAALQDMTERVRNRGSWSGEWRDWLTVLNQAGISPDQPAASIVTLQHTDMRDRLAEAVVFAWRAGRQQGAESDANRLAAILAAGGPTPAWQALGRLLGHTPFKAHDPQFQEGPDSVAALAEAAPTGVVLAIFAPEPRLIIAARAALVQDPGAFWPLLVTARDALDNGQVHEAEHHALVASGAAPGSVLPHLILAYVALGRQDWKSLETEVEQGLHCSPRQSELLLLRAVALARLGRTSEGQQQLNALDPGHLQYHILHPVGHPMERGVQAALAAGLTIAAAEPALGPLTTPPAPAEGIAVPVGPSAP